MKITSEQLQEMIQKAVNDAQPQAEAIQSMIDSAIKDASTVSGRKALVGAHGEEVVDKALQTAGWFKGLYDMSRGKAVADDLLYTGVDGQGGYLVPTEIMAEIARLLPQKSLVAQKATFFPQEVPTVNLPTLVSGLAVTYPNETAQKDDDIPVFGQVVYALKTAAVIVPMSNQLIEDSVVDIVSFVNTLIAESFATDLDTRAFANATSPYTGILSGAGKNVTLDAGETIADITFGDLMDMIAQLQTTAIAGAEWFMSPTVFAVLKKMKDSTNQPINFGPLAPGLVPYPALAGYPLNLSDNMPTATNGGSADTPVFFFGNIKNLWIGRSSSLSLSMSKEASITVTDGTISAFQRNLTLIRGELRRSMAIAIPNAFVKLVTGSGS